MILRTKYGGEVSLRSREFGLSAPPAPGAGAYSWAGGVVTTETAGGIPAVMAAIRLIAETIATMPLIVYEGRGAARERAEDSWQWELLHEDISADFTTVSVFSDLSAGVDLTGNSYAEKLKDRQGQVVELNVIPTGMCVAARDRETGRKVFRMADGSVKTPGEILHIRGFSHVPGAVLGMSPITMHRHALGAALAIEQFEGGFYRNGAAPGGAIKVPGRLTESGARELLRVWNADHQGAGNAGKTSVLHSGAEWVSVGLSLRDAQFIESRNMSVKDIARIFRVPAELLENDSNPITTSDVVERFLKFGLGARMRMIESALRADADLFAGTQLYPEFLADALLRASTRERYEAYRAGRQGGWLTINEPRAWENLPPIEGGDDVQLTPVGGAPNAHVELFDPPEE